MIQGVVEKECYIVGGPAYIKTCTGKELWFDEAGHVIRRLNPDGTEDRYEYYESGVLKHTTNNGYELFYNPNGTRDYKVYPDGYTEYWEYDNNGQLSGWHNSLGHQRAYVCNEKGKVVKWYGNESLIAYYKETGRRFYAGFSGLIPEAM